MSKGPLAHFHEPVRVWFEEALGAATPVQARGWKAIAEGRSALMLAPTGSGKTLAAFLAALDRLAFRSEPEKQQRLAVLYVSPLKALAADIEKNLVAPIAGIRAKSLELGVPCREIAVSVRTGDTPARERSAFARSPTDILITTPESLYLLLTSEARARLASVDTVIVDEIHSLAATKRGAHLFLSLERLEALRSGRPRLQRIGLSATQRPLGEIARLLGGGEVDGGVGGGVDGGVGGGVDGGVGGGGQSWSPRPVEVVDASAGKQLELRVEVPIEDMARLAGANGEGEASIWPSIHPRLVELVRAHRSSMIFVNNRRLAERLAAAINETAGETLALAHHGSVAKERRREIEERLKSGLLPAIVATSSLELGIDMGAVDLVIQIEAPPSVASGIQRIGRAGHQVGAPSKGVIVPKYRGDLLACAAAVERMMAGQVEATAYLRNPLDVLSQQIVAIASVEPIGEDDLYALVRRAAPYADLPRGSFEGVLDMLSGRYPSDEFAELRPRLTWDRRARVVRARRGAKRLAVVNAGTIPDRGLYGVFLSGSEDRPVRVGELDEEMVFECRVGDVFVLGASSWRIDEISHDRVLVRPAPGEPGRMPFWHGDRPGRAPELGLAMGALARELADAGSDTAARLRSDHALEAGAAENLRAYVRDELAATGHVPSDRTWVVERFVDEVGDFRVCLMSPMGSRVHAPLALAMRARARSESSAELECLWSDDGIVFRFPESDAPPDVAAWIPRADEIEDLLIESLGTSSLFAARFRENAARALLLPRRYPGKRSPLWAQRKRSADLLRVAARYGSFPILLETYRECLRDVFDLPALVDALRRIESRELRVVTVDTRRASPFAAALLFAYVGNFIYDDDAPLAERRARALTIDSGELAELLGEAELRELLDPEAIESAERSLLRLTEPSVAHPDQVHDLLLGLGPLSLDEIGMRVVPEADPASLLRELLDEGRVFQVTIAGDQRVVAAEDIGRLRDALGVVPSPDVPRAYLEPVADPLGDLCSRYARTHGPFSIESVRQRFGVEVRDAFDRLIAQGRVVEGEFLPGGRGSELCDVEVLRTLKRRSLAKLRREIEPVDAAALGRFTCEWHEIGGRASGQDALATVVDRLEGAPLVASVLESEILPARLARTASAEIDLACARGEIVWRGLEPLGDRDGRIALYHSSRYPLLAPAPTQVDGQLAGKVRELLAARGASFFQDLVRGTDAFGRDVLDAIWDLVWSGEVTNDTLAPLRSRLAGDAAPSRRQRISGRRAHPMGPPGSEGRWSLLASTGERSETERRVALAELLLERHGVLTREAAHSEGLSGGFSAVYDVLKQMEERGRVRRGYFVAGLGGTQFALPGAVDRLRRRRSGADDARAHLLAATDPANPYGAVVPWPESTEPQRLSRSAGASVVIVDGALAAYLARGDARLQTFSRDDRTLAAVAAALFQLFRRGRRALLIEEIDGGPAQSSAFAPALRAAGFSASCQGLLARPSLEAATLAAP